MADPVRHRKRHGAEFVVASFKLLVRREMGGLWVLSKDHANVVVMWHGCQVLMAEYIGEKDGGNVDVRTGVLAADVTASAVWSGSCGSWCGGWVGRIYLGAHYPGDILGGAVLGLLCALAVKWIPWRLPLWGLVERTYRGLIARLV